MEVREILDLNGYCESQHLEVKVDLTREVKKKFLKSIISLLNSTGGYYIIGINDQFKIEGIDNSKVDEYTIWISNKLCTGIFNYLKEEVTIEQELIENKRVIVVSVKAGSQPIYYEINKGIYSGTYIKVGTTTQVMDRMKIDSIQQKFVQADLSQMEASHQMYQITNLKRALEESGASTSNIALHNFGLFTYNDKKSKLYELLSDENSTVINFAVFATTDKVDLLERENFGEVPLFVTVKRLLDKVELYNKTNSTITSIERIDSKLIDPIAIRELIINAIVHNDYSIGYPNVYWYKDRVEVSSNGGLPIGMTFEEFYNGQSRPRNPKLAFLFTKLGLVEQLGSGVERILRKYDKSIFDITNSYFKATLHFNNSNSSPIQVYTDEDRQLSKRERSIQAILTCIAINNGATLAEIEEEVGLAQSTVYKHLNTLLSTGKAQKLKENDTIVYYTDK